MAKKDNTNVEEIFEVMDKETAEKERELAAERFTATADEFTWGNVAQEWAEKQKKSQ